jgi:hypothetical protein
MDVDALVNALQVTPPHASRNLLSEVRKTFAGELTLHTGLGSKLSGWSHRQQHTSCTLPAAPSLHDDCAEEP